MTDRQAPIIEFENVTFKYRAQQEPTLKDINLKIYRGEKILIADRQKALFVLG